MKNKILNSKLFVLLFCASAFSAAAQTSVYFTNAVMTGDASDRTINIKAVNNPVLWNGRHYSFPMSGTNVATTNGVGNINLVPGKYTAAYAGIPKSWTITVTNSAMPLNAADLTTDVVIYSGVQALGGTNGIIIIPPTGLGGFWIIDASGVNGGTGSGETNIGANLGNGATVFKQKSGAALQFRSLTNHAGSAAISNDATQIYIEADPTGAADSATNYTAAWLAGSNVVYKALIAGKLNGNGGTGTGNTLSNLTVRGSLSVVDLNGNSDPGTGGNLSSDSIAVNTIYGSASTNIIIGETLQSDFLFGGVLLRDENGDTIITSDGWLYGEGSTLAFGALEPASGKTNVLLINSIGHLTTNDLASIIGGAGAGALIAANNLLDVASASTALANLGGNNAANLSTGTLPHGRLPSLVLTNGDLRLVNGSSLLGSHHTSTDSGTNLVSNEDATGFTNIVSWAHKGTGTNLISTFNGTLQSYTVTNGPDLFFSFAGANGSASYRVTTNATLHFSYNPKWLAGSNSVITNGVLSLTSYGGTNASQIEAAIVENQ